MEGFSVM